MDIVDRKEHRTEIRLSVVVPCFNEEGVLPRFHDALSQELAKTGTDYEIIYVDDGSVDGTLKIVRDLAQANERFRYLSLSRNFGKEAAMLAGLRYARGDAVVIMDADLQHPPQLINDMLERFRAGCDQVVARRTRGGDQRHYAVAARLYYRLVNKLMDVRLVDGDGDFRLLSRRALDALLSLQEYSRFSKGLFSWIGFEQSVVEYDNVVRNGGRSKWNLRKLLNYGLDGLLSFNNRPLRLAIWAGLSVTLIAVLYMIWIIGAAIVTGVQAPGYVTLLTAVVALGGLQMVMLGIIGEYIGRVYYETKRRPHFLIKENGVSGDD